MDIEAKQNEIHPKRRLALRREGYTSLAAWMTLDPDNEALIFRKFDYLSARRTLHLQSQLLELEDRLRELDASVSQDVESKKSLKKHEVFVERAESGSGPDQERMELLDRIHQKLDEYRNESSCRFSCNHSLILIRWYPNHAVSNRKSEPATTNGLASISNILQRQRSARQDHIRESARASSRSRRSRCIAASIRRRHTIKISTG